MPGEWDFQNNFRFTRSSPIDLGRMEADSEQQLGIPTSGGTAEFRFLPPSGTPRQLQLGMKRNSVFAGLGNADQVSVYGLQQDHST